MDTNEKIASKSFYLILQNAKKLPDDNICAYFLRLKHSIENILFYLAKSEDEEQCMQFIELLFDEMEKDSNDEKQ